MLDKTIDVADVASSLISRTVAAGSIAKRPVPNGTALSHWPGGMATLMSGLRNLRDVMFLNIVVFDPPELAITFRDALRENIKYYRHLN
jgi:hypothetical protein